MTYDIIFFHKKMVPESKLEWNREAITVFSRLPSLRRLQATPTLQTSLNGMTQGPFNYYVRVDIGVLGGSGNDNLA